MSLIRRNVSVSGRRLSLPLYISFLLISIAILTLIATIGSIEIFLRPALINQISSDTEKDAQTQVQLIDSYFSERLNDVKIFSQAQPLQDLLSGHPSDTTTVTGLLFSVFHRDVADYISLSVLNTQEHVVLTYPTQPQMHGQHLVQPEAMSKLNASSGVVTSDVFYDPLANNPSIDLYANIFSNTFQSLGIVRASISLHRLWAPVDNEAQQNGSGSYAFVLDENGVRIAYTNSDHSGFTRPQYLFKAVQPITPAFQQRIKDENLYGNAANPVTSVADSTLANIKGLSSSPTILQFDPTGQDQTFVAVRYSSTVFPWTYFVLKPLSSVASLADQQLQTIILIVSIVILLAVIVGVQTGRRITLPIVRSIFSLHNSSATLKALADQEQIVATEQTWMVEASQVAMKSIKYYTLASRRAARRLAFLCSDLRENPQHFDKNKSERLISEMSQIAEYIEKALNLQEQANEKLASSIRVTTQAAMQLTGDAKSTDETALELEQIVQELMVVVGNKTNTAATDGAR